MKIAVLGVGSIGGHIARQLVANGHEVRVANSRGKDAVREFADQVGAIAEDQKGAVKDADAIIISIPFSAIQNLPADLFWGVPNTVPVIDTGNYYPGMRDPKVPEIESGMAESVWVETALKRPVTKAFNMILAYSLQHLGKPKGASDRIALAVAGDVAAHKQVASAFVEELGFDAVDSGGLEASWRQQPGTPAYCCDYDVPTLKEALQKAVKGKGPEKRDYFMGNIATLVPQGATNQDFVETARRIYTVE